MLSRKRNFTHSHTRRNYFLIIFLIIASMGFVFIYKNHLYRFFLEPDEPEFAFQGSVYQVQVSKNKKFGSTEPPLVGRALKVSFPLSQAGQGCEFVYGAAVAEFSEDSGHDPLHRFGYQTARYLLRFKYDHKNSRCESKDIFLNAALLPAKLSIQLIRSEATSSLLIESPESVGIALHIELQNEQDLETGFMPIKNIKFEETQIAQSFPFLAKSTMVRASKFSVNLLPNQLKLLISPFDDLKKTIIEEIDARIQKCNVQKRCDKIKAAVAVIDDPDILLSFERASKAGIEIQVITNLDPKELWRYSGKFTGKKSEHYLETIHFTASPWYWLKGSMYDDTSEGILPMHTKFIIFGNDTVISANPNFSFETFYKSREISFIYKNPEVVAMFNEIFGILRSGLFYPLEVNLDDNTIILLNVNRDRGYSVTSQKPYLSIRTNEGITSSAYGILYEILSRTPGKLLLAMSPLTSSCASYAKKYCLFDILQDRSDRSELELLLNAYFYLSSETMDRLQADYPNILWTDTFIKQNLKLEANLETVRGLFRQHPEHLSLKIMVDDRYSNHHERFGLLGSDVILAGSANYASPSTVNTIEILRSKEIAKILRAEYESAKEPYFIVQLNKLSKPSRSFGGCEFVFERDLLTAIDYKKKTYSASQIMSTMNRDKSEYQNFSVVWPKVDTYPLQDANVRFQEMPLSENVESFSSSFCLKEKATNNFQVIHVR